MKWVKSFSSSSGLNPQPPPHRWRSPQAVPAQHPPRTPVAGAPLVLGASSRPAPVEAPSLRLVSAKAPLELAVKAAAHTPAPTDISTGQEQTGYLSDMGAQPAASDGSGYLSAMGSQPAETEESGYLSDMGAQPAASDESGYLSAMGSQPAETDDAGYLSNMDSSVAAQCVDLLATFTAAPAAE